MTKLFAFSFCCVLVAVGTICWVAGAKVGASERPRVVKVAKAVPEPAGPAASEEGLSVYFSPNGGATDALIREISAARIAVYVQGAQFTSVPIAKALIAARTRGVDVRVILDRKKDDDGHAQADRIFDAGVPIFADGQHHTAHNKVVLIDHRLIFTGSFNFTPESEMENAENLLRIENKPQLLAAYEKNFKEHLGHSKAYQK